MSRPWRNKLALVGWRAGAAAGVALLCIYMTATLVLDQRGSFGTDEGGKLATLHRMAEQNRLDPDLGYWASTYDPEGELHPLYFTMRAGPKYVNTTTLPMVVASYPLYRIAGARAALLPAMAGAVGCAFAAMALARRFGSRRPWVIFWLVGLASPVALYGVDYWEHSIGLALLLWAVVFAIRAPAGIKATINCAALTGLFIGLAATMRTEALVYGFVMGALICGGALLRRELLKVILAGGTLMLGLVGPMLVNHLLERAILGTSIRSGRALSAASSSAVGGQLRAEEAIITTLGFGSDLTVPAMAAQGLVVLGVVGFFLRESVRSPRRNRLYRWIPGIALGGFYGLRFAAGLGFVPGFLIAAPIAVVGLLFAWTAPASRTAALIAVLALPMVWLTQYSGGAGPQWGGRYVLTSSLLLFVLGAVVLERYPSTVRKSMFALCAAVTAFGFAWLSVRSHAVGSFARTMVEPKDTVSVSRVAHLFREIGAGYDPDDHRLTAVTDPQFAKAVTIAEKTGDENFRVIDLGFEGSPPRRIGGFTRQKSELIDFFPNYPVRVSTYRRR